MILLIGMSGPDEGAVVICQFVESRFLSRGALGRLRIAGEEQDPAADAAYQDDDDTLPGTPQRSGGTGGLA